MTKTKMLVWSDYVAPTGFANVMSNILRRLPAEDFDIDIVAINYFGDPDYDRERYPGRIWPAFSRPKAPYNDVLGRQKVIDIARESNYDTIFILQDPYNASDTILKLLEVKQKFNKWFKLVFYFPLDSPAVREWITNSASKVDIPITYTKYAAEICAEADPSLVDRLKVIPHGIDIDDFYYIKDRDIVKSFRNFWFPAASNKFLLVNVNRNQPRKDIPRSLMVLRELKNKLIERGIGVEPALYLHCSNDDLSGDLRSLALQLGLERNKDLFFPRNENDPYPVDYLNQIYNAADALITTSTGEGWGLSLTEAMACKTVVIAPDNSSITEIIGDDERGILVKAGHEASLWTVLDKDKGHRIFVPLTSVEHMVDRIIFAMNYDGLIKARVDAAYEWVQFLNWDHLVKKHWLGILAAEVIALEPNLTAL